MARVKRGVTTHARHQKVIKAAKGYYGARKNSFFLVYEENNNLCCCRIFLWSCSICFTKYASKLIFTRAYYL